MPEWGRGYRIQYSVMEYGRRKDIKVDYGGQCMVLGRFLNGKSDFKCTM